MRAFLKSSEGCFQLKSYTTTIGSHRGADIVLQSAGVAELHAALEFSASDNSFILQDFNSPHGTFVNSCQVQNAAVRVRPGDILSFGTAGASFELVLEGAAQMSCPPLKRHVGWSGQLQVAAEPKPWTPASPLCLPSLQGQLPPDSLGSGAPRAPGRVPHLVLPRRPASARDRNTASATSLDTSSRTSAVRPVSASFSGDGASSVGRAPSLGPHKVDLLLQGKQGEKLLDKEVGRLFGLETELKGKDVVMRDLQEEIAAMAKKLAQAAVRNEAELTQKLLTFNQELGAQTEEIKALREQINDLQKGSNQVFSRSLHERDLEVGRLQRESEKLKRDQALTAGLVSNMQRELLRKEQKIQQLQQETEKLSKENREKDKQLAVVSAKCSRIKEETKHELREQELISCRNRIEELQRDLEGLQGQIQKHESVQKQLAEKAKAEEELKAAWSQQARQLREMERRERLLRSDVQRAGEQLESFKTRVMQVCSPSAAGSTGKPVTEQQVIEKVRQISDENKQSHEREKTLQKELSSRLAKEREVSANIEVFKNSLQKLQACLRSPCSSASLQGELGQLQLLCLDPCVSAIRTAVVDMARGPLSWLEGAEQLLDSAGMDLHTSGKGLLAALGSLLEKSQEMAQRNQMLQEQLEKLQELQAELLQEHTKELEAKHEQDLQIKIQQIVLEKDKESKQILETAVTEEKDKCKKSVEEEQRKIQELESHLRSMAEATAKKAEEQELTEGKLREALHELKTITAQEAVLQQQVLQQSQQLRAVQEENELQRQKLQEEVAGYREQSRQHSLTILALEDRLLEATQQQKVLEEEKAALVEKMEGLQCDAHSSGSGTWLEICPAMESHVCLRKLQEELAVVQGTLLEKKAVISRLSRELSETRARMSDMRGELSEEQKVELEHSQRQLKHREWEVNQLQEKLSEMSSLVEEKDQALRAAGEELSQAQRRCQVLRDASQQTLESTEDAPRTPVQLSEASQREPPSALAELGAKCRGLRHEETIQRQREGLAELRERVKMLEKRQGSGAVKRDSEPLVVWMEDLPEKIIAQQRGLELEPAPVLGEKLRAGKVPDHVPNGSSFRITNSTVSLEMAEATDLGEKMYLDVIAALGSLVEMKELSGMQPLQHLPRERRAEVGLQRQKALGLLYKKIRNLQVRLERKEEMLKDYEGSVEQLRQSQASLQRCQEEMSNLEDEAHREAEEKALLREALERMQLQLDQEKRLRQAAKRHKPGATKILCSGKPKAKGCMAGAAKSGSS
ncbi:LOW QUALITY PROTEIN: forkhead-associated domain-containing protein 1 [Molothrus ater]|uniref:LOW QUALITY PROTEIN: forkhead-associated domain-containing protein 1 n=1 Tax=Molothrus ater TaxID=84834 RepID=UPI0023E7AA42|nr:LOW QUALITY PROTEIN: forkhead-associated domain-containing protein 1 [Molothrus ater]